MQWDTLAFLPHPTDITDIAPPTIRLCSLRSAGLVKRVWPAPDQWLRDQMAACWAGFTSPVAMSCMCFCVAEVFFLFSHCTPQGTLGVIFFSSLSSCKCCIFLQFYLHFTTDYTCMIVYVTNNKEPWTLNLDFRIMKIHTLLSIYALKCLLCVHHTVVSTDLQIFVISRPANTVHQHLLAELL